MVHAEVDQSGKIEQFNMDTVVALSYGKNFSVLLPKRVKQEIFMKNKCKFDKLKYKLFVTALFYCMKEIISDETKVVICKEYEGNEQFLKSELVNLSTERKSAFVQKQ